MTRYSVRRPEFRKFKLRYKAQCTAGPSGYGANPIRRIGSDFEGFATVTPIACHIPPPIKRSKILVSGGVVIVIPVKLRIRLVNSVAVRTLPENPYSTASSD
jgi:hypothetical protein